MKQFALILTEKARQSTGFHRFPSILNNSTKIFIDLKRFSSYLRLIRVTAYVRKFIRKIRGTKEGVELEAKELNEAENLWVKTIQGEMLNEPNFEKRAKSMGTFKDENGIILANLI